MRFLRGLGGVLLWLVASLVVQGGVVLCVTVILLPLGIAVLLVARRIFGISMKLLLPREMTHPVDEASRSLRRAGKRAGKKAGGRLRDAPGTDDAAEAGSKARTRMREGGRRLRRQLTG